VSMETLRAAADEGEEVAHRLLLPVEAALSELAVLNVGQNDAARLLRGQAVLIRGRDAPTETGPTYATCKGHLIAVGRVERGELHPLRVFNFGRTDN
jgi:tRNA pseudouridine55 synthase